MKVLVVSSRFPYPLYQGDRLRLYHQIKELSEHYSVYLICVDDQTVSEDAIRALKPFCKVLQIYRLSLLKRILNSVFGILKGWPVNISYFYHFPTKNPLQQLIADLDPDYLYTQLIRAAPYTHDFMSIPKGIDYMDSFSLRWKRKSEGGGFWKWIWKIESRRLAEKEKLFEAYFDDHFVISPLDNEHLQHNGLDPLCQLPNGVDTNFFYPVNRERKYDLVFVGNMQYEPNVKAAIYLVNEILPKLNTAVNVLIAGASPTTAVRALGSQQVEISGFLDDIRDAYWSGSIFVAPIFMGSGMQNKILEAMASGCLCISTPQVIKAIKGASEIIVSASNKDTFATAISDMLARPAAFEERRNLGPRFVQENFSWKAAVTPLIEKNRKDKNGC